MTDPALLRPLLEAALRSKDLEVIQQNITAALTILKIFGGFEGGNLSSQDLLNAMMNREIVINGKRVTVVNVTASVESDIVDVQDMGGAPSMRQIRGQSSSKVTLEILL